MSNSKRERQRLVLGTRQSGPGLRKTDSPRSAKISACGGGHGKGGTPPRAGTETPLQHSDMSGDEHLSLVECDSLHIFPVRVTERDDASPSTLDSEDTSRSSGHSTVVWLPELRDLELHSCADESQPKQSLEGQCPKPEPSAGQQLARLTRAIRLVNRNRGTGSGIEACCFCQACIAARASRARNAAGCPVLLRRRYSRTGSGGSASLQRANAQDQATASTKLPL